MVSPSLLCLRYGSMVRRGPILHHRSVFRLWLMMACLADIGDEFLRSFAEDVLGGAGQDFQRLSRALTASGLECSNSFSFSA